MTSNLKPYPHYKPSGVEWLGDVPAHWEVRRLKYLLSECSTRSVDGSEQLLSVSQYTGVTERKRAEGKNEVDTRAESLVGYKCVEANDLVVNIMLAWNGSMGVSRFCGIVSPSYCVYRFKTDVQPWYFHFLLRSPTYKARIRAISTGIVESRLRMYTDDLYRLEVPLPPPAEQAAIVRYLDHTDGRILRYLRSRERLIELLKEYRQATIHETVTRGLDPDVPLKPSGVEWIGDVPAHWDVRRLKNICRLAYGDSLSSENRINGPVPVYGSNGQVGVHSTSNTDGQCLIVGRKGSFGKVHYSAKPVFAIDTTFFVDRRHTGANIRWLYYLLGWLHLDAVSKDSAIPGLNREDAYQHIGCYPPLAEQTAIAAYLDKQTTAIDAAMARAQREINLLSEYRMRLIADVVTGQVDVREAMGDLSDEEAGIEHDGRMNPPL